MFTARKDYARFAGLLDGRCGFCPEGLTFRKACRLLHVSPATLNEVLQRELGMSGDDIMVNYFGIAPKF